MLVAAAFVLGVAAGFGWALTRRHPASPYRQALQRAIDEASQAGDLQTAALAEAALQDVELEDAAGDSDEDS